MVKELVSVDITRAPDLLRLAEAVQATKTPRVLRRDDEDLAVLMPIRPRRRIKRTPTKADLDAFLGSAGSWRSLIDLDEFKQHVAESRGSSRRPVDL
jgi:hypothetical protein